MERGNTARRRPPALGQRQEEGDGLACANVRKSAAVMSLVASLGTGLDPVLSWVYANLMPMLKRLL